MDYVAPSECLPNIIETNGKANGVKQAIVDPYEHLIKGHLEAEEKKKVGVDLLWKISPVLKISQEEKKQKSE